MTRHSAVLVVAAAVLLGLCTGCTSSYMETRPLRFDPCSYKTEGDPQRVAMAALVQSLEENRWRILQGSAEEGFVRAEACRRSYCVSIDGWVDRSGRIDIYRTPHQHIRRNGAQVLEGWMVKLEQRFSKNRCTPDADYLSRIEDLYLPGGSVPVRP